MPKVSVIVPVYNVEKYLERCVNSLRNQTLEDIEIILVDDGSPDNCPKMCDDYVKLDNRIKVIHKKNEGLGFARNSGLEIASGEFVAFVDSDDFIEFTMYEDLYNLINCHNLDTIYCGYNKIRESGRIESVRQVEKIELCDSKVMVESFLFEMIGSNPSYNSDVRYLMSVCLALYSRDLIVNNLIKFSSEREFISEDLLFNLDYLFRAQSVGIDPGVYYNYCFNETSLTRSYNKNRFVDLKKLQSEIERRMKIRYNHDLFRNNLNRLKILHLRSSINHELNNLKLTNFKTVWNRIKFMCNDSDYEELFANYPYNKLPFKHRYFFLCLKFKVPSLFILMTFVDLKMKK